MTEYSFKKDLPIAQETEKEVSKLFEKHYNWKTEKFKENNEYDLLLTKKRKSITVEIKEDFMSKKTGNFALEYESRGKPSGIRVCKAEYYLYKTHLKEKIEYRLTKTERLKWMIEKRLYHRIVSGGDIGSETKMYLFSYDVFCQYSKEIFN